MTEQAHPSGQYPALAGTDLEGTLFDPNLQDEQASIAPDSLVDSDIDRLRADMAEKLGSYTLADIRLGLIDPPTAGPSSRLTSSPAAKKRSSSQPAETSGQEISRRLANEDLRNNPDTRTAQEKAESFKKGMALLREGLPTAVDVVRDRFIRDIEAIEDGPDFTRQILSTTRTFKAQEQKAKEKEKDSHE